MIAETFILSMPSAYNCNTKHFAWTNVKVQGILREPCPAPAPRRPSVMANARHAALASSQRRRLRALRREPALKPRERDRVEALLLSADGLRVPRLARHWGCCQATVRRGRGPDVARAERDDLKQKPAPVGSGSSSSTKAAAPSPQPEGAGGPTGPAGDPRSPRVGATQGVPEPIGPPTHRCHPKPILPQPANFPHVDRRLGEATHRGIATALQQSTPGNRPGLEQDTGFGLPCLVASSIR